MLRDDDLLHTPMALQQFSLWSAPQTKGVEKSLPAGQWCPAAPRSGWTAEPSAQWVPVSLSHCECHWCCPCSWGSSLGEEGGSQSVQHGLLAISFAFHSNSPHSQDSPTAMLLLTTIHAGDGAGCRLSPADVSLSLSLCRGHC